MIYLCSPYTHPDPAVRHSRFEAACRATAELMRAGRTVFSPIVHSHPLAVFGVPTDWAFWERCDRTFLERSDEVAVLTLDGWRQSVGVQAEVQLAFELDKPISYLLPAAAPGSTSEFPK